MAKAKCKVVFKMGRIGPEALLMHQGKVLNSINYYGGALTKTDKAHARKLLMRGCQELARRR